MVIYSGKVNKKGEGDMNEPICGWKWFGRHRHDHTRQEIESLSIVLSCDGRKLPPISHQKKNRGLVKELVKSYS